VTTPMYEKEPRMSPSRTRAVRWYVVTAGYLQVIAESARVSRQGASESAQGDFISRRRFASRRV